MNFSVKFRFYYQILYGLYRIAGTKKCGGIHLWKILDTRGTYIFALISWSTVPFLPAFVFFSEGAASTRTWASQLAFLGANDEQKIRYFSKKKKNTPFWWSSWSNTPVPVGMIWLAVEIWLYLVVLDCIYRYIGQWQYATRICSAGYFARLLAVGSSCVSQLSFCFACLRWGLP